MEDNYGYYSESGEFIEAPKKEILRIQVPYILRFAIMWTAFFIIIGLAVQYYQADNPVFGDIAGGFFTTEYGNWFKSFGTFTDVTLYSTPVDFVLSLLSHWYYFFYTGGLISLIWGLLSWLINFELVFKKRQKLIPIHSQPKIEVKQIIRQPKDKISPTQKKIKALLDMGHFFLEKKDMTGAKKIYQQINQEYNFSKDISIATYKEILDFYAEIHEKK